MSNIIFACTHEQPKIEWPYVMPENVLRWCTTMKINIIDNDYQIIYFSWLTLAILTHWGRVTHICVSDLTSIGSDNGLSPGRRQAIIRTNAGILLMRPLGTNFSEFLVEILIFSFRKMRCKRSSAKRRPFFLGLNKLKLFRFRHKVFTRTKDGQCDVFQRSWHGKNAFRIAGLLWRGTTRQQRKGGSDAEIYYFFVISHYLWSSCVTVIWRVQITTTIPHVLYQECLYATHSTHLSIQRD